MTAAHDTPEALLMAMFRAAVDAADPAKTLAAHLPERPKGRCIVIGAGKAAASMALAVETAWPDVDLSGVVVTRYGHSVPTSRITVREAAHPVPDESGAIAAQEIIETARQAGPDDLVLALISGGGSALLPAPVSPLTLADEIAVNRLLLRSGLPIDVMNAVRRRISLIKGGGLARAASPAKLVTLAISDVPGDEPIAIASGPTVPAPYSDADMTAVVALLGPDLSPAIREVLLRQRQPEAGFDVDFRLIASPVQSLKAAAKVAQAAGYTPVILGDTIEGEACQVGTVMAGIARSVQELAAPAKAPAVLLSGGETTVTIGSEGYGRGGRNTEFLLSLALALQSRRGIHALAADTDGIDGTEDAAGAIIDPDTLERARKAGLSAAASLRRHDSYSLFDALGSLVRTGPTMTNVNDFRAILVNP